MDLYSALLAVKPAIKPPAKPAKPVRKAKPAPKADRSASARPGTLPRVAVGSFDCGRREVFGTKEAHSESREPPTHEYFPERHFGGPLFSSKPWYPFSIHRTTK